MQSGILVLHILVCIVLIVLILLQSGREGMGVIFGGGGNSSVFGSQGAGGVLVKLTAFLALMFVVTSLGYNILTANKNDVTSVLDVQFEESASPAPAPAAVEKAPEEVKAEPIAQPVQETVKEAEQTPVQAPAEAPSAPAAEQAPAETSANETAPAASAN